MMALCIAGKHQCQCAVAGHVTCSSEAVLRAKMVSINAVPELSNFSIPVMMPRDAMTVPPGTPGAPMAKIPRRRQNRTMVPGVGTEPYRIFEIAIQKKTSVRTEPQRWMFANRGVP